MYEKMKILKSELSIYYTFVSILSSELNPNSTSRRNFFYNARSNRVLESHNAPLQLLPLRFIIILIVLAL